jgi:hypothetical protein
MRLLVEAGNERGRCPSDFTRWKEHDAYQQALDLRVEKS